MAPTAAFEALFSRRADAARMRPFSAVLINMATQSITGITCVWKWRDPSGQERSEIFSSDSYFVVSNPVVPSRGRVLLTPSFLAPDSVTSITSGYSSSPRYIAALEQSSVSLTIDTLIFYNGDVFGPDETKTIDSINSRTKGAHELAETVLESLRRGLDPAPLLEEIMKPVPPADEFGMWTASVAEILKSSPNTKFAAEEMRSITTPVFTRR